MQYILSERLYQIWDTVVFVQDNDIGMKNMGRSRDNKVCISFQCLSATGSSTSFHII